MFWLHYTAALVLLAEAVWIVGIVSARQEWKRLRSFTLDFAIVGALCLPALPQLWDIAGRRQNWEKFVPPASLLQVIDWFSLDLVAVALVAFVLDPLLTSSTRRPTAPSPRREVLALAGCWFLIPTLTAYAVTSFGLARLFYSRYLAAVAMGPILVGGFSVGSLTTFRRRLIVSLLVASLAIWQSGLSASWLRDGRLVHDRQQPWGEAVEQINRSTDTFPVLLRSGFIEADHYIDSGTPLERGYCLAPITSCYAIKNSTRLLDPLPTFRQIKLNRTVIHEIQQRGGVWLLCNGSASSQRRVQIEVVQELGLHGARTDCQTAFRQGQLVVLRIVLQ